MPAEIIEIRQGAGVSEKDRRSIEVLNQIKNARHFKLDEERNRLRVYHPGAGGQTELSRKTIPVEDFLAAVEFYYNNRGSDHELVLAVNTMNGFVNVYKPTNLRDEKTPVVATLTNFEVVRMLELAFLLGRRQPKS